MDRESEWLSSTAGEIVRPLRFFGPKQERYSCRRTL